jgi:hypothetical protein
MNFRPAYRYLLKYIKMVDAGTSGDIKDLDARVTALEEERDDAGIVRKPMTLDEAIEHALQVSQTSRCKGCRDEHRQLAEWLTDYKRLLQPHSE